MLLLCSYRAPSAHSKAETTMHRSAYLVFSIAVGVAGAALAKLPAPTPEEQAAAVEKKKRQEQQLKAEKAQLEKAQDRVVRHYRQTKGRGGSSAPNQRVEEENIPKTSGDLPGGVGPKPDRPVSGEAHSAPPK
jgi:hypothetical protein